MTRGMDEVSYLGPANFIIPHFCVSAINFLSKAN